ncbi:NAD(P)/FAD-dependent oxidoreductase [Nonomuraea diastatica]|uniref:NAD(P)/FAD-dependent oxidoreductase n=1 Tax=Nonomuraea diastatica TaxID=1848329 RepID=A0A4R4WXK4_9ACTN|nr:FAD-dependent oxidoreductase [Nonomuraea diastatica]TDD22573.1 NAD(P)/FAD-dependent oxidoreductase [Nonomuraea diastatica]
MKQPSNIVVVGASAAGLTAAEALRHHGYTGALTIVGAEPRPPYDRPPLSKQILRGTWHSDRVTLRRPDALTDLGADWRLGVAATSLDTDARKLTLADGTALPYHGLVIATGVVPRKLPAGHELGGVHLLRTLDDALALRDGLLTATSVAVVGAGFLGTEVAAAARERGPDVTLIDPLPAPLIRPFGDHVARLCAGLHAQHGVRVRSGTAVSALTSRDGRVTGLNLDDGDHVTADLVLVAIGSTPAVDWLTGSGLNLDDGIRCDQTCRAAPGVVAAGDLASWPHPWLGRMRVEHRMNATEQGTAAARTLLGAAIPYAPVSYFWTDQYDVKIQAYGRPSGDAELHIITDDPATHQFAALYSTDGHVTGAVTWNLSRQARALRHHVAERTPWRHALRACRS